MIGRSKDQRDAEPAATRAPSATDPGVGSGKGRPTPSRKEAEAANKRPLVPTDRKAAAKDARTKARIQRDLEYKAMQTGDERHLPPRDRGPVRRYTRDHVDARWSLGEFFMPVAAAFLVLAAVGARINAAFFTIVTLALYVYVIAAFIDGYVLWRGLRKKLVAKFGVAAIPKGLAMYAALRAFQLRPTRLPKALVKHGQYPA